MAYGVEQLEPPCTEQKPACLLTRKLVMEYEYALQPYDAELQRSCSQLGSQRQGEHCQSLCHCRYYPPLPPPPPPPPPPRLLILTVAEPPVPLPRPWWKDVVVVTVGCTSAFFLLLILLICYKAIKWKPLKKQENGTSRGEYAMSCRKRKITNNVVV
ncbi:proline-rich membrane anchor 1-like isoform 1-T1 [Clarias gariepinus]|uniref:proline-rich membrane anchor 1-like isoform X1 n=1 Tax=Clarias gariepinus TaxID=13013 RepID=UPI00234CE81E|nr:proline-rich membrane anchor 1-like isoform X1 [Clarias gariepinus]